MINFTLEKLDYAI